MGWARGTEIFSVIIKAAKKAIPDDQARKAFYREVYEAFADADWDCEDECFNDDPVFEQVYRERWPNRDHEW